ncbi:MAG: uracil-DNA glycosylase family protein [Chloroflexota bacterium]
MTLAQLHAELRACRLCLEAGYEIAPGAVFSSGPVPQVMLIGQAPGVTEAAVKRPFNAGSGTRLFQWLAEAGWPEAEFRARHYMTAVTKCFPGKATSGKGDRVPSRAEQALCRPYLEREMALVKPRLIIPVGGLAIKLFFPGKLRLDEIVGSAVYFPPDLIAANPVCFSLKSTHRFRPEDADLQPQLESLPQNGRWLVPLPHPSGASLWPNKPANQRLISRALAMLNQIREKWGLDK